MTIDPVSPLPAIAAILMSLATSGLLLKIFGAPPASGRFLSIDGLRGYLAFFVFLHHGCIWYFYLRTGAWDVPPSRLYSHFGQSSVAMFFMITGFLFYSKLLNSQHKDIDWLRLLTSRLMRLFPLYLFAMLLLMACVLAATGWHLQQSPLILISGLMRWLSFTILGNPDLNTLNNTLIVVAGVTWSLPYEWFFYLALPVLALTTGKRPHPALLLIGLASLLEAFFWRSDSSHMLAFLGGIIAALLAESAAFCRVARHPATSVAVLTLLGLAVSLHDSTYDLIPLLMLSAAFSLIAGGNSLFGLLTSGISRTLGEMAYSIYLLHGITLFVLFRLILDNEQANGLTTLQHWLLILAITPLLILLCFATFRLIEQPGMRTVPGFTRWLRKHVRRCQQPA